MFGIRAVMEAISSGQEVEKCLFRVGLHGQLFMQLLEMVRLRGIPFQFVPPEKIDQVTRKNHQGVLAFLSEIEYGRIEELIPMIYERGDTPFVLVLDQVTDVRNFGAIARTAECAGVHTLLVPHQGSAMINPDAVKTSAGALHSLPVCRTPRLGNTIKFLSDSGLVIIAATEKAGKVYHEADYTRPLALVLGSEEKGIQPANLCRAHEQVSIPLKGRISSLNVSVAAGILCYEVVKQRSKAV